MSPWREELRGNRRLRAGLLLIGGLLWLGGLLALMDAVDTTRAEQEQLHSELDGLRQAGRDARWARVRDEAQQSLAAYRSRSWREESDGRMQALMQDWLRERMAELGLQPSELNVSVLQPASEAALGGLAGTIAGAPWPPEMRVVRSRLVFDFQPAALHNFLTMVSLSPNWLWVSRLAVRNGSRRSVEIELEALFVQGARGGT